MHLSELATGRHLGCSFQAERVLPKRPPRREIAPVTHGVKRRTLDWCLTLYRVDQWVNVVFRRCDGGGLDDPSLVTS